jgi:hypothetical protein
MRVATILPALAAVLSFATLSALPAHGEVYWVATNGNDASPCGRTNPCQHFQQVLNNAASGVEIRCIDSGDFGGLLILKSATINCEDQVHAAALNAVIQVGSSDVVVLKGLDLHGANVSPGSGFGVIFSGGGVLVLDKVTISDWQSGNGGLAFTPNAAGRLVVVNSKIYGNGASGDVVVRPTGGADVQAIFNNSFIAGSIFGLKADGSGQSSGQIDVEVRNTIAFGNTNNGFIAVSNAGQAPIHFIIDHSVAHNNGAYGAVASGAQAFMFVGDSVLAKNGTGLAQLNGSTVASYGNNAINFNVTNTNGAITAGALR